MTEDGQEKSFPLSLSQRNIWDLECAIHGTSVNNICTTIHIEGRVDFLVLRRSINEVLLKDAVLRTRIFLKDGEPYQRHDPFVWEEFPIYDFTNTGVEGVDHWEKAMTGEAVPMIDSPLYRFILFREGEDRGGVLVKVHHIISDGWSQVLLCNRIGQTYLDLLAGKEPCLKESPGYELHVEEERRYLESSAYERDRRYWKGILERCGEPSVLKEMKGASVSPVGRRLSFELPQVLNHAVYSFCVDNQVSPFAVFYMALAVYFKRIGGADRFTIGVPIVNRTNYQFKCSTGMFVSTLPFYNEINDEWTFREFNGKLMEAWYELLRHQRFPFSHIEKMAGQVRGQEGKLFHIAFSYQDSKIFESPDASVLLTGSWHYSGYQSEQMCIHLTNLRDNRCYRVDYDYLTQFFTGEEVERLHHSLCGILAEALENQDKPLHSLKLLTAQEREKVLYSFNRTGQAFPEGNVYEVLEKAADKAGSRVALINGGQKMTYAGLMERSRKVSAGLRAPGGLAAVLLPRSFELMEAIVGILRAGCAYLLLAPDLPAGRIRKILERSGADLLVTSKDASDKAGLSDCPVPCLYIEDPVRLCCPADAKDPANLSDAADAENPAILVHPADADTLSSKEGRMHPGGGDGKAPAFGVQPDDLVYVVYTSGSTGEPKGVEITHRGLLNLAMAMKDVYGRGAVLSVCGVGFDAFMLESIVALLNGKTIVLPEEEELESPGRLAEMISRFGVGFFSMTPSRLAAFMKNTSFCEAMRRMESVVCGGEAFPPQLLKELKNVTQARIYNQYGPSEATVAVSMKELSGASRITAGAPLPNCRLYVLDKRCSPLPVGVYGQLYVGGVCVGRGYRNDPGETQAHFFPNPFENGEMMYATGDLACWTKDGEIVLSGRLDRQVKLNGLRVEPQEAAACIASHPKVKQAAARTWKIGSQTVLAVYYCSDSEIPETELLTFAASYLPRYMVPSYLVRLEHLPMSANGKVQEERLPKPDGQQPQTGGDIAAQARFGAHGKDTGLEGQVLGVFRRTLGRPQMERTEDYFLSGGSSLNAMETIAGLEELTGIHIRVADLYACRSAARLTEYLLEKGACSRKDTWLKKAPPTEYYALSPTQQGIYIQSLLDPAGLAYNMPGAFRLEQEPDRERLEGALRKIIQEDDVLRTSFVQEGGAIRARIQRDTDFFLGRVEGADFEEASASFVKPFDLGKAPLLRAALWKEEGGAWYLFLDSHHIIGDGMSTPLLLERLNKAYCGRETAVYFCYPDYLYTLSQRQQEETDQVLSSASADYWKRHLAGFTEALTLPADFARPHRFDFRGREYRWVLSEPDTKSVREFSKEQGISPYVLFLAAFTVLLSRISQKHDFVLGAPAAGRLYPGTSQICGPFINTLPLRLGPRGEKSVSSYLEEVREEVNGMLDHQQTSLEEILSFLALQRGELNPLYSIMFSQSPVDTGSFLLGDRPVEYCSVSTGTVKMDLTAELSVCREQFCMTFSYASGLFLEETIAFYARCMERILKEILAGPQKRLKELMVLSPQDQEKYVDLPNYRTTPFVNLPIHCMIEKRNACLPDAVAVMFHGRYVTRGELEKRASGLAGLLREAGVTKGQCIGLGLARTPDLLAAMLAILKTGCAYVPFLPSFPEERLSYMLETACVSHVLCDELTAGKLPAGLSCRIVTAVVCNEESFDSVAVQDEDLVNVMFTSGSTGKPKGVMLRHRSVSSLYVSIRELLMRAEGPILCTTNVVFDSFIGESLFPLAMGKPIVLMDEEEMMLPWKLGRAIRETGAEIFQVTPARLQMCLGNDEFCRAASSLKLVLLGGEVLTPRLVERLHEVTDAAIVNMYGPTEATVYMTMTDVSCGDHITIGRPLYNSRIYVLDEEGEAVMPTGVGELYMAGECLAKGYISRPDLTEKAFLPDPFFPGERMYKSGDLGRLRLDGTYDFLGRRDAQVKLNGQRVELDEITGAILGSGCVGQAATVALQREDGSMGLCAFYVPSGEDAAPEELRKRLKKILPAYMVPGQIIPLAQMPLTASSKIDRQELMKIAGRENGVSLACKEQEDVARARQIEQGKSKEQGKSAIQGKNKEQAGNNISLAYILEIWSRVLGRKGLDADVSFFDQGGTSLAALNVLSFYFNEHLEMTLSQFYENPTARQQAELLDGEADRTEKSKERLPRMELLEESLPKTETPDKRDVILLTGATGFLGVHLLMALLERSETREVICLMRDGSKERLFDCMAWYFGRGRVMRELKRITVLKGDISAPGLGMSHEEYTDVAGRIKEIYHAAADVRHYASDTEKYMDTNVEGTRNMIRLAEEAGAAFYYMSTCSVGGEQLRESGRSAVFTEADYDIGQRWEDNIYVKSKFLAEGLVLKAAAGGLPVKIFRVGRLVGRASDGVFQKNPNTNVFWLLMRGFYLTGAMPRTVAESRIDLTPVDYCAEAVLALRDQEGTVFHIIHPCPPTAGETAQAMGGDIRILPDGEFNAVLEKAACGTHREELSPLIDFWQRIRVSPPAVSVSCEKTQLGLRAAGFDFPIPGPRQLLYSFMQEGLWSVKGE